jgi:hypothetical protein
MQHQRSVFVTFWWEFWTLQIVGPSVENEPVWLAKMQLQPLITFSRIACAGQAKGNNSGLRRNPRIQAMGISQGTDKDRKIHWGHPSLTILTKLTLWEKIYFKKHELAVFPGITCLLNSCSQWLSISFFTQRKLFLRRPPISSFMKVT